MSLIRFLPIIFMLKLQRIIIIGLITISNQLLAQQKQLPPIIKKLISILGNVQTTTISNNKTILTD